MLYEAPGLSGDHLQSLAPRAELPPGFPRDRGWAEHLHGEDKQQLHERVERSVKRYVEGSRGDAQKSPSVVAIVSHAHFGGFFLGRLFRIPVDQLSSNRLRLSNCGVSQVTVTDRYRQLEAGNHTAHLDGWDAHEVGPRH
jgi:broad specificity phosphatase PhoE